MKEATRFTADFETTVDPDDCRVWAWGVCEIREPYTFFYGNDIDDFMFYWANHKKNCQVSFHNLKFDSSFILSWLNANGYRHITCKEDRADNTYETLISDMGAYYSVTVYFSVKGKKTHKVTFLDSMKIFNMSVDRVAKDFDLPISKLKIDYKAKREIGHELTREEIAYLRNDVEIMARALDIFYQQGFTKITISSNALASFKSMCKGFSRYFPEIDDNEDGFVRMSYKGGFTYVNPVNQGHTITKNSVCLDVNSLYPSRLRYCYMPYDKGVWFDGKYQKDNKYPLYVQSLICEFELKKGKIPSIQIKGNLSFVPNEYLTSSNGDSVQLTLTNVDLELFFEQYKVKVIEYIGGYKYKSCKGLFNNYVDYWTEQKTLAKKEGNKARYSISKMFQNSLYGRFATSKSGRQKIPVFIDDVLHYDLGADEQMKSVYLPVATWVTSYGRRLTIETSQKIRDWSLKNLGFDAYEYSDTDSIYAILTPEQVQQVAKDEHIELSPYQLGAWDVEEEHITRAKFLRQKCYIKEIDGEIHATVAGCPKALSRLFTFKNFKIGFTTASFGVDEIGKDAKLRFKQVKGGVILQETDFTIK